MLCVARAKRHVTQTSFDFGSWIYFSFSYQFSDCRLYLTSFISCFQTCTELCIFSWNYPEGLYVRTQMSESVAWDILSNFSDSYIVLLRSSYVKGKHRIMSQTNSQDISWGSYLKTAVVFRFDLWKQHHHNPQPPSSSTCCHVLLDSQGLLDFLRVFADKQPCVETIECICKSLKFPPI